MIHETMNQINEAREFLENCSAESHRSYEITMKIIDEGIKQLAETSKNIREAHNALRGVYE